MARLDRHEEQLSWRPREWPYNRRNLKSLGAIAMQAESLVRNEWSALSAPQALAQYAPTGMAALHDLIAATAAVDGKAQLVAQLRELCATTLMLTPLQPAVAGQTTPVSEDAARSARAFAEQLSLDVSSMPETLRNEFLQIFSAQAFPLALAVYVADFTPRLRRTLERLFHPAADGWRALDAEIARKESGAADVVAMFMEFVRVVYNMQGLDPVTSELVRLRGARQHHCRICKSLRAQTALAAGANDADFEAVDHYADSELSARHKAALALVDAIIWQPAHIADDVLAGIRTHFTPAEAVELVLDIMRNSSQKAAVALGSDAAPTDDVQIYHIDETGAMHMGLERPAVTAAAR